MMENKDQAAGKLKVTPGTPNSYFNIGGDQMKSKFEQSKKEVIDATVKRIKVHESLKEIINGLQELSPILVTGSSGYLGSAVVETLREHKIQTIGIDLVNAATTDFVGCVSDVDFLRSVIKGGCNSIIHTAALHAPNLDFYSDDEYERVNVVGTKNILMISKNHEIKAVVFSSTTSLMITDDVKEREKDTTNVVVLKDSVDYGAPRNIYGTTKKIAEKMCMDTKEVNIAILRCSRFFVEDVFDTGAKPSERKVQKSNGNTKANEMLCGTRASLEDTVLAHLVALDRLKKEKEVSGENNKIGPLIISSISPLLSNSFDVSIASTSHLYKTLGWSLPVHISRIYDSSSSWKVLEISPKWNFERLVREYEEGKHIEVIQEGRY